jgi:hypothetical protein
MALQFRSGKGTSRGPRNNFLEVGSMLPTAHERVKEDSAVYPHTWSGDLYEDLSLSGLHNVLLEAARFSVESVSLSVFNSRWQVLAAERSYKKAYVSCTTVM